MPSASDTKTLVGKLAPLAGVDDNAKGAVESWIDDNEMDNPDKIDEIYKKIDKLLSKAGDPGTQGYTDLWGEVVAVTRKQPKLLSADPY